MFCRSPRQLAPPRLPKRFSVSSAIPRSRQPITRLIVGVSLAVSMLVLATAPSVVLAAEAAPSGRPPEILSWRHQFLDSAEYLKLAGQWEAFVTAHPTDARALVEWGNALRYSGKREEADTKYKRAFEVDSLDAAAVEAYATSIVSVHGEGTAWKTAHQMLVRSFERDPGYAKTLYALWYSSLRAGDQAQADRCLRGIVESGDMPHPLLEYGANMLEGAPPNAIILTNGDNDTYPPLAYQLMTGRRRDVAIANLSLLNTTWYIRYLKGQGIPITLTDSAIDALKPVSKERLVADQVVEHIAANSGKGESRPLLYAVTVPDDRRRLATGECRGLLVPVTGDPAADEGIQKDTAGQEAPCDGARTRDLLDAVYRTDGAIDPVVDWKRESAVASLMRNYVSLNSCVGDWLASSGSKDAAGVYYLRAVRLLTFHGDREHAQQVLDSWADDDPQSRLLPEARKLLQK